jgi:hypothetical protein
MDREASTPIKKTPTKRKQQEKAVRGKQVVDVEVVIEDINIIWKEKFSVRHYSRLSIP